MTTHHPPIQEEAFELMPGCPTLSFPAFGQQWCVPYYSFKHAIFRGDMITVSFQAGSLTIRGRKLTKLWRHFQMQDVRSVRRHADSDDELAIEAIEWMERKPDKADPQMELGLEIEE